MKVGDKIKLDDKQVGKVVRFYANQGTVLVELEKDKRLTYWDYSSVKKA